MEQANKSPFLKEEVLGNLFQTTFKIPHYQRPYKWRKEHVIQLLDDLYENIYLKKNAIYRVGSIIIHDDKTHNNIVDGQQRLTTLSLIFHYLKEQNVLLQNENYKHEISKNNIKYNYQLIENWFLSKSFSASEKQDYLDKIKKGCQFVIITVYQQDEAFQLFDSQNSRGKPLEPYDLLKAFHLREMENDAHTEAEIEKYAVQWEDYLLKNDKPLKSIFENHLFRIRKWAKREKKYLFSKNDISEFKGISLYKGNKYTYEIIYRLLDGAIQNAQKDKMLRNFNISQQYPFQITMPIINGKVFFDYVFHYIELKRDLFENIIFRDFQNFYTIFTNYEKSDRIGDLKVKNLFENICMLFTDRFGIDKFDKVYYTEFYKNCYQLRLDKKAINDNSVLNYEKGQKFFYQIPDVYQPEELHQSLFCNYVYDKEWSVGNFVKGSEKIYKYLTNKIDENGATK